MNEDPTRKISLALNRSADNQSVARALRRLAGMIEAGTLAGYHVVALHDEDDRLVGAATIAPVFPVT